MVIENPWGQSEVIRGTGDYEVRRLLLAPGERLPLQRHRRRSEHWVVVNGMARVTRGPHEFTLHPNESVFIPAGTQHRLENHSVSEPLEVIEVQVGGGLDEDDVERFQDAGLRV
jgi:mannose-6-phosphate isomerase-like protein (cupin superfamily)